MKDDFLTLAFTRARNRLKSVAMRFSSTDLSGADDMLQEAFCRLWRAKVAPKSVEEAEALGRTAVRNIAIDSERRLSVHRPVAIDTIAEVADTDAASQTERSEVYGRVEALIATALSERDRQILLRRDRDEWEMDEIASHFSITEANARVIISRARRTIRELYLQKHKGS